MSQRATPAVEVAAGLVFHQQRLLITQRHHGAHLGGLWEFPGGKRHAGETFALCLARELKEELDIEVEVGPLFERVTHEYPGKIVHLEFFLCSLRCGDPKPIGCADFRWVEADGLAQFAFPAADARLLERLRSTPSLWAG